MLADRAAALLADDRPGDATHVALHLNGQVLPLEQDPAGAVYWAMQDIVAAGPTGDNPGAAGALLAALAGAVQRDLAAVATLPSQFVDALTAEGKTLLRTLLGPHVIAELDRAGDVVGAILANPLGFFAHLATALKDGFTGFLQHIGQHLTDGLMAWLGRALGDLYIELPKAFDLTGVVSVALQVLDLTYSHVRALLVAKFGPDGEARVAALEQGWDFLQNLAAPGGLAAAWPQVQQIAGTSPGDLLTIVVGGLTSWLEGRLTVSVTEHLLTLCSGAGSIVAAVQSIYTAVTFFINNRDALAALADRVLGMVSTIATGKAADLAHLGSEVEATMAGTLPLLIDVLARQFGLGDIGAQVQVVIGKVRGPITTMEERLVASLAREAPHVPGASSGPGHGHGAGAAGAGEAVQPGDFPRETVATEEGAHTIWIAVEGGEPVVMLSSTPRPMRAVLDEVVAQELRTDSSEDMVTARRLVVEMAGLARAIVQGRREGKPDAAIAAYHNALIKKETRLATLIKGMLTNVPLTRYDKRYELEGLVGTYANMPVQSYDKMTGDHQPQSAALKAVAALPAFSGLFIQHVVRSQQSDGGYVINLYKNRRQEGRTFGPDGNKTAAVFKSQLVERVGAAGSDVSAQRRAAIGLLEEALAADVAHMRNVARRPENDTDVWGDIHALPRLSPAGQKRLIGMIRARILEGEDRIAAQNLDRLTYKGL